MATVLPAKTNQIPMATDDDHHEKMSMDPSISEFPEGSAYGSNFAKASNTTVGSVLTNSAESNAASGAEVLVANTNTHWLNHKWRPLMALVYMVTCITDFVIFPVLWSILQAVSAGNVTSQWQPLTLQGAGLFHLAMGAVLGIAAYGRTKEKIEGKN